jgi:hypothetical protein
MTAPWDDDGLGYDPVDGRCNDLGAYYEGPEVYCMRDPGHDPEWHHRGCGLEWGFGHGDWIRHWGEPGTSVSS